MQAAESGCLLSKRGQRWCAVQCLATDQLWFMSTVVPSWRRLTVNVGIESTELVTKLNNLVGDFRCRLRQHFVSIAHKDSINQTVLFKRKGCHQMQN